MNRDETREFLIRYYRKRSTSFLANIYKASITGDSRDIHRARLDVKKIFALYGLFELVDPINFNKKIGYKLFRPLYRKAGKIREIQVNYLLLEQSEFKGAGCDAFISWLKEEEQRTIHLFLLSVKKFRERELNGIDKEIEKICFSSSMFKLRSKTVEFIKHKAKLVNELQLNSPDDSEIHKIRQHLKSLSTITAIVYSIKPNNYLDQIVTRLNKTEIMIGEWHDRVVLKEAIDHFLADETHVSDRGNFTLDKFKQVLTERNETLVQHFMPEVDAIVKSLLII